MTQRLHLFILPLPGKPHVMATAVVFSWPVASAKPLWFLFDENAITTRTYTYQVLAGVSSLHV